MEDWEELAFTGYRKALFSDKIFNEAETKEKIYQDFKSRLLKDEEFIKFLVNEVFNFPVSDLDHSVDRVEIRKKED